MGSGLSSDQARRVLAVREAAEGAGSLSEFLSATLAALDEHLGHTRSAFMLALGQPPSSGRRAYAGLDHGMKPPARRTDGTMQLSFRIPGRGRTDGYLTVTGNERADRRHRAMLGAVVEHLAELLPTHLPVGLEGQVSPREAEVSELVALGFSNREIAAVLHVEEDTVKKHVSHAIGKLGLLRRTQLAVSWATGRPIDVLALHSRSRDGVTESLGA
jgi:DNA-binding CsgD family transcriptional regulator